MKNYKHIYYCFVLVFCALKSQAQDNLVPNGNFEDAELCVSGQTNYYISRGWFSPQSDIIPLVNPCYYGVWWAGGRDTFGINKSKSCYFETYGFFTLLQNVSHHRAYLATQLKEPLVAGQDYYFEMSFRTIDTVPNLERVTTDFTDAQSISFSAEFPTYDWSVPNNYIRLKPVLSHGLVKDYDWHKLKGCFRANGGEKFLIIGNFKPNNETTRTPTGQLSKTPYTSSNQIVDNIILVPLKIALKDTVVCKGQTVTLNVQNSLVDSISYRWHDNSTTPQYIANKTEQISVRVYYPAEKCIAEGEMSFKSIDNDYHPLAYDTTICQNEKAVFTAGTGLLGETITWKNGSKDHQITVHTEGTYLAEIKNRCASWTDTFRLRVQHCGFDAFVPTAFSPNGDGVNDEFRPFFKMDFIKIESYDLRLFNRWGSLVFASQNVSDDWDGTYRGNPCESGVYIWTITVRVLLNGKVETKQLSGDVTIIR